MTLTKEFASKLAVAFVAAAMVVSAFAPAARAQTTEELQQMINDLLAQVAMLQGQVGQETSVAAGVCPYTWTRSLSSGSTGMDVMKLQQFLNADADTRVAAEGVGSAGMETEYYGPATAAAVSKFQVKYRADVLTPAGLVNPTGYFGPSSMSKANGLCVAAPVVVEDEEEDTEEVTEEEEEEDTTLSGEATLYKFETDSASDDELEEGAEDAEIAEVTIEFRDGDAEISRLDLALEGTGDETDPWDVFESISLWIDGDKVAEEAADDRDDYLDEDDGSLRFSGLSIVGMEDEEVEIVVAATLQSNLDGVSDGEAWTVEFDSIRYFDADGVATTDTLTGDLSDNTGESFDIVEEGYEDEVIVKTSSNDPDAATLQLDDSAKSDWYTIFVFDIDTDDSTNDITINEIPVTVAVSSSTVATFFDDLELVVDGVTIDSFTWGTDGATRTATFDVDGDVVIDAGDRVEVELMARFKSLALGNEGVTASGSITTTQVDAIDAEGADDLTNTGTDQLRGSATGEDHTLRTSGLDASVTDTDADVTVNDGDLNDYGTYVIEFEVTAFEQDVYIAIDDSTSLDWDLENSAGTPYTVLAASSSVVLSSTADDDGTYFEVTEGETETFTLTVTYTPVVANRAARLILNTINFAESASTPDQTQDLNPASDWRTAVVTIVN